MRIYIRFWLQSYNILYIICLKQKHFLRSTGSFYIYLDIAMMIFRYFCISKSVIIMTKRLTLLFVLLFSFSFVVMAELKIKTGKEVTITAKCVGAIDESTLDKIVSSCSRGDETILRAAVKSNYAVVLTKGTKGTVVQIKVSKVRIKLSNGRMVWVLYKHVK